MSVAATMTVVGAGAASAAPPRLAAQAVVQRVILGESAMGNREFTAATDVYGLRHAPRPGPVVRPEVSASPVASPLENQLALSAAVSQLSTAIAVGPLIGVGVGAVVGVGVAIASCAVLTFGCVLTGLPTVGVVAAAGALAGTVLLGGAAAVNGAWNYVATLSAPPGQSSYARQGGLGTNQAGLPDSIVHTPRVGTGSGR